MIQLTIEEWILNQSTSDSTWKRIPPGSTIIIPAGVKVPEVEPFLRRSDLMEVPDLVLEGEVNKVPAYIGYKEWVSGPNEEYYSFELLQWKERRVP